MAKSRKTWRGREVYERLLAERDREGLTWAAISTRSGVPISTLQEWARRLREEAEQASAPAFIAAGTVQIESPRFEVELRSGRRLHVPMRFDADALDALLSVLDRAC